MTPSARLQAAIELLGAIENAMTVGPPADRVVSSFFSQRRYAGSKDRAAVADTVYGVLRCRAELVWRLDRAGEVPACPEACSRRLVLAYEVLGLGLSPADLAALCDGGRYAPAPLEPSEAACLDALASGLDDGAPGDAPGHVRGNYPQWLDEKLRKRFGGELPEQMAAFAERASVDVRVNLLRTTRDKARAALVAEGIETEPCRLSPVGLRLVERASLGGGAAFRRGMVEVQDEGSQIVCLLTDARPGMQVLDLCAGAGGKTLGIAAAMAGKGQVYACDVNRSRLERMRPRLKRAAAHNVQLRHIVSENDPWLGELGGGIDRVLVDAPCSGSGTWRRNPDLKWRLTPEGLDRHVATQRRLMQAAAPLVKVGGRLVYATCSILPRENEDQVDAFIAENPDFRILPVGDIWPDAVGGQYPSDVLGEGPFLSLTPLRHRTDGFFVAVLERTAPPPNPGWTSSPPLST